MLFSADFRNAVWTVTAANSANCTIKFYSSNQETRPDLDSAASATNQYSTVEVVDLEDRTSIDGDTGVSYAGSGDGTRRFELEDNYNRRIGVIMTARSAGDITLDVSLSNNY